MNRGSVEVSGGLDGRRLHEGVAADCSSRMNKSRGEGRGGCAEGRGGTWKELEGEEREGGEEAASLQRLFIDKVAPVDCSWVDTLSGVNVLFLAVCLQADAEQSHP